MIATELDYVKAGDDINSMWVKVVDAETGEEISIVTEANAIDGWLRRVPHVDGKPQRERFINDKGQVEKRVVEIREERAIAILWIPETPASQKSHEHRLKPEDQA